MELNEEEKRQLFQVDGDCQAKVLDELYMTARFTRNPEQLDMVRGLMAKLRVLSNEQCMDLVKDIQKNYHLPYPRTMGERIALARQQSGAEKLKGHDIMALERFDPEVRHMVVCDVLSFESPVGDKGDSPAKNNPYAGMYAGNELPHSICIRRANRQPRPALPRSYLLYKKGSNPSN